jgi:hypothetical protein
VSIMVAPDGPGSAVWRTGWSYIWDCVGEPLEDFS